jgi:ABC-type multidrug transport system ATPase subunit
MKQSQIRESQVRDLLEKVRKRSYGSYLRSLFLKKIRHFEGATINFDFPVTALVGPNGAGKSTVLGAAACAYKTASPKDYFFTSVVGDQQDFLWEMEYELVERSLSASDATRVYVNMTRETVNRQPEANRLVKYFGIHRTLPPVTSPFFMRKYFSGKSSGQSREEQEVDIELIRREASRVLGKELSSFKLLHVSFVLNKTIKKRKVKVFNPELGKVVKMILPLHERQIVAATRDQQLFVSDGEQKYSEFNFGAGEASVLRLIHGIEQLPEQSLVLIEEIENGLHPLAVERLIEYLIAAAIRRKVQVIFTTHSDYALHPLPSEAVWSALNGRLIQGTLSVESLRALSGRIDKRLAVFTEDFFAKKWVEAVLREGLREKFDEVGIYHLTGDDVAVRIHLAHNQDPAATVRSLCFIDGDSRQTADEAKAIYRLPGESPELFVFNAVYDNLESNAAILTAGCQRPLTAQKDLIEVVREVANTNRDPHLLFAQVGARIGLVSEEVVRGAFFAACIMEKPELVQQITTPVLDALSQIPEP